FSSRRRHTRFSRDWSSDVCSSDLGATAALGQNSAQEEAAIAEARAATIAQLSRPITIELTDARLEDIVQFLRDFTGANIEPMWRSEERRVGEEQSNTMSSYASSV